MITKLLIAWFLMALCVAVHAIGLMGALRRIHRSPALADPRFWPPTWLLIRIAGWLIFLHLIEIALWALLYAWRQAMPDIHSAFYFSTVTYTTTGYGDLVLPEAWRLVGGIKRRSTASACGLPGFLLTVVNHTTCTARGIRKLQGTEISFKTPHSSLPCLDRSPIFHDRDARDEEVSFRLGGMVSV
jgi:hypothetical protein